MEVLASRLLIHPADLDASLRFYDEVLGLHRAREFGEGGRITGVVWFAGGGFIEVSRTGGGGGMADGSARLWLQVRDVDADPADLARWSDKVPVVLLDDVEHAYWRIDERVLRSALKLRG